MVCRSQKGVNPWKEICVLAAAKSLMQECTVPVLYADARISIRIQEKVLQLCCTINTSGNNRNKKGGYSISRSICKERRKNLVNILIIVGESGCGKSTTAELLLKFIEGQK